jgi:hypothetical protein
VAQKDCTKLGPGNQGVFPGHAIHPGKPGALIAIPFERRGSLAGHKEILAGCGPHCPADTPADELHRGIGPIFVPGRPRLRIPQGPASKSDQFASGFLTQKSHTLYLAGGVKAARINFLIGQQRPP